MVQVKFKEIESVLNSFLTPFYWNEKGKKIKINGEMPKSIDELEKNGYTLGIGVYIPEEDDGRKLCYFLDTKKDAIVVKSKKFTEKECAAIIDIIKAQMENDDVDYSIAFGSIKKKNFVRYCEKCTSEGHWCEGFIKSFNEQREKIKQITIKPMWLDEIKKAVIIITFE